ncbi:hypothetical protein D3C79_940810 [compost metagenome]
MGSWPSTRGGDFLYHTAERVFAFTRPGWDFPCLVAMLRVGWCQNRGGPHGGSRCGRRADYARMHGACHRVSLIIILNMTAF